MSVMRDADGYVVGDVRGPRVDTPTHRSYGWWLTWEVADGPFWRYEQRRMTRLEIILYRLLKRVPRVTSNQDSAPASGQRSSSAPASATAKDGTAGAGGSPASDPKEGNRV